MNEFNKLRLTFGSKTKAQEIVLLQNELKEVVRQGYYEQELEKVQKFCQENRLHFVKSRFKVLLMEDETTNYSNKGMRIPEEDKRQGMFFVYISKDEQKAWLAAYHEIMQNDSELGKVLGYPDCCIKFFSQHFSNKKTDLQLFPTNPWTNLSQRGNDAVLISHFPCHAECQESVKMAKKNLQTIRTQYPERAQELVEMLRVK